MSEQGLTAYELAQKLLEMPEDAQHAPICHHDGKDWIQLAHISWERNASADSEQSRVTKVKIW